MGGGILPVARFRGEIMFLLGKEVSSGKWCDFGGGREGNETKWQTAMREGAEELNGFLGCAKDMSKKVKRNGVLEIHGGTWTTYVLEIDYDPLMPVYFNNQHRFIKEYLPATVKKHNGLFEKSEIKWFSIADLRDKRRYIRHCYKSVVDEVIRRKHEIAGNMIPQVS